MVSGIGWRSRVSAPVTLPVPFFCLCVFSSAIIISSVNPSGMATSQVLAIHNSAFVNNMLQATLWGSEGATYMVGGFFCALPCPVCDGSPLLFTSDSRLCTTGWGCPICGVGWCGQCTSTHISGPSSFRLYLFKKCCHAVESECNSYVIYVPKRQQFFFVISAMLCVDEFSRRLRG